MVAAGDFRALGTGVRVLTTDSARLSAALQAVEGELAAVDAAYSRFREDSELMRLHDHAGRWTSVSPLLFEALEAAVQAARLTEGAVDPTVGGALRLLGYDRDYADLDPDGPTPPAGLRVAGWETIELDRAERLVRFPRGTEIDLGATGKALAVDRAAASACRASGCGVLVSVGGDMTATGPAPEAGWPVLVAEDHAAPLDSAGDVVAIHSGGLATSSTTVRRWKRGGIMQHHIVHPETGRPVTEFWRTVSVVAATCVQANAAATAAIVLGKDAQSWLASHQLAARLVGIDGQVTRFGGWPQPEQA